MHILLTSFEPFGGALLNSSAAACDAFLAHWASEHSVRYLQLPVEYGADTVLVEQALEEEPADLILHTGQAGGPGRLRVERLAVNVRYLQLGPGELPDEAATSQGMIDPDGPPAYFSGVPVEQAAAAIAARGLKVRISNHAGIYLCNHVFYRSLQREAIRRTGAQTAFLHIPRLAEQLDDKSLQAGHCMPADAGALAIQTLIETAARRPA